MKAYHYFDAGMVERGPKYQWRQAFSRVNADGTMVYPWETKREAQADAKSMGRRAVFHETKQEAQNAAIEENQ